MTPEQVHSQVFGRGMPMVLVRHNRLQTICFLLRCVFTPMFQEDAVGAWPALEKWTRKNLERHYAEAKVMAGAIPCERRISPSCPHRSRSRLP